MEECLATDAQADTFNFHLALKTIYDELRQSDFNAMKFLCTEFISIQKMEKVKTALDLFEELKTLRKIIPPDNVRLVAELLYCLRQYRLLKILPYGYDDVKQSVEGGGSQIHPCRYLLHRICEDITNENFKTLRFLCRDISKSAMEKILIPHDLILALEKLGFIQVKNGNLRYLRDKLYDAKLEELVDRIDQFQFRSFTGGSENQNVRPTEPWQSPSPNNITTDLYASRPNISPPSKPLSQSILVGRGFQNTEPSSDQFAGAVPKGFSSGISYPDVSEGAGGAKTQGSGPTEDTLRREDVFPSYSMTRRPRGICLIFNNKTFHKDENDPESILQGARNGSEKDCKLLEDVFGMKLDFMVVVWQDLTDTEICTKLLATASTDHSDFDCFVCCILSHGVNGAIYGANGKLVEIKRMTSFFRPSSCRSLCGKPKLFFIQACQGNERQRVSDIVTDGPTIPEACGTVTHKAEGGVGTVTHTSGAGTVPDEADFLVALSTVPGYVSFRSKSRGSWYITTLVKMLEEHADRLDLLSILTIVNDEISRAEDSLNGFVCKQVAMPMTTLRKQVRFHPK